MHRHVLQYAALTSIMMRGLSIEEFAGTVLYIDFITAKLRNGEIKDMTDLELAHIEFVELFSS
ncbi:hypothetical protein [Streptomyces phage Psst1]|nr:hypothetical protein [Streptomyces phage Psst1]WPJ30727.1 hypothetical protein [Streptomyces phage Psst2]